MRPIEYTPEKIRGILEKLDKYINETQIPIVAEFAYLNDIRKATLYEIPELAYSIKRLIEKKEAMLEKGCLTGQLNASMAIFSLKQLGWTDKQSIEHSGEIANIPALFGSIAEQLKKKVDIKGEKDV